MALRAIPSPRFAVPESEAYAAIRRMVRVFFDPSTWEDGERQVEERFARKERYGSVEGERGGRYDERPACIAWKPYETAPDIFGISVLSRQFGHHLVEIVAIERSVGRKVQPLPQGFRLERPLSVPAFESMLGKVLDHEVDLAGHLHRASRVRLVLELLGGLGGNEAPDYQGWLRSLPSATQARVKAARDFVWSRRKGQEMISQMEARGNGLAAGLVGLLQEGGGFSGAEAAALVAQMLDRFPPHLDWQAGLYAPLRIPIENDWLEVDFAYPLGVREGAPYVPDGQPLRWVELILHPDTSRPLLHGVYDRQCLILDAVDEIRKGFGLPPDARFAHYRDHAMQD